MEKERCPPPINDPELFHRPPGPFYGRMWGPCTPTSRSTSFCPRKTTTWLCSKSSIVPVPAPGTCLAPTSGLCAPRPWNMSVRETFRNLLLAHLRLLSPKRRWRCQSPRGIGANVTFPAPCPASVLESVCHTCSHAASSEGIENSPPAEGGMQGIWGPRTVGMQSGRVPHAPCATPALSSQAWRPDHAGG